MLDEWACGSRFLKMRMEGDVAFVVWLLRMNMCISMYLMTAKNQPVIYITITIKQSSV